MRSEATFRFSVDFEKFLKSKSLLSPPCHICNFPWKIIVLRRQDYLGLFLECNERTKSYSWSCYADAEFRIISHNDAPYSKKVPRRLYCCKQSAWGLTEFITWEDCVDPENGFIKDDAITLEAHVIAYSVEPDSPDTKVNRDQTRSEVTLRYKVNYCENLESLSPPIDIFNFPWHIKVVAKKMMVGPNQNQSQHLGLYLMCTHTDGKEVTDSVWSCNVNLYVELISFETFCKTIDHLIFGTDNKSIPIISWDDVVNPDEGYIKDNVITMKIKVTSAQQPIQFSEY